MGPIFPLGYSLVQQYLSKGSFNKVDRFDLGMSIGNDISKVGSYFPGVSLITGIARLSFTIWLANKWSKDGKLSSQEGKIMIGLLAGRSILEITCVFGPVLLIADIATTAFFVYYELQKKQGTCSPSQ